MSTTRNLPATHQALIQKVPKQSLVVEDIPVPQVTSGSAILRIEAAGIISYQGDVYNGTRPYPYPTPMVTGLHAIGRVVVAGPDATALEPDQLVFFDSFVQSRDDPSVAILSGLSDAGHPGAQKLMAGEWRDSTFAQFARVPLENCHLLNELRLYGRPGSGGLGYSASQLTWLGMAAVGYGGLRSIDLQAGETIVVAPATGGFGGAAALVAAAMGARVVAMGRNEAKLKRLAAMSPRIHSVPITSSEEERHTLASFGPIDAFLDLSPPNVGKLSHFTSAIKSLRKGGRVSVMGGMGCDVPFPFYDLVFKDLTLKGKWMYSKSDVRDLVKLVETGVLSLEPIREAGSFKLDDWQEAFETASQMSFEEVAVFSP